jgi:hypothetical protein
VLAANAVFIGRNRTYFDGNPWVGGKLGEWMTGEPPLGLPVLKDS